MPEEAEECGGEGVAAPARPGPARTRLPAGWPVLLLFAAFPLWWLLGLSALIWMLLAVPMLAWLAVRPGVRVPKGFGLWIAFLGWMLFSATQLDQPKYWIAFSYRAALYVSMTILFIYVYNLPRAAVPSRKIALALTSLWAVVVVFGFLALAFPDVRIATPAAQLLPGGLAGNPFVQDLFNPKLAQVQYFVGYPVPRPAAPFTYTNEWGGAMGLLTPLAIASLGLLRSHLVRNLVRLLLVASLVPMVVSQNRGLWIGLGVGLLYMAALVALRGKAGALVAILASLVLAVGLVAFTPPLRQLVEDRVANPHSNERRASLGEQAVEGALQSPLLGYGGPRESAENPNQPDVGTHGQVYLVLFSHGIPGLVFFLGWWLWALWVSRRGRIGLPLWAHAVLLIGLIEFLYYDMMPTELHLMMVVAAIAWRELEADARPDLPARTARPVRERPSPAVR